MSTFSSLKKEYDKVKVECGTSYKSDETAKAILSYAANSLEFLTDYCIKIDLVSKVPDKKYFSFTKNNIIARPANKQLFIADKNKVVRLWDQWLTGKLKPTQFARLSYTVALAPCLAMELFDRQNKKGPATYFECFIGHIFAKAIGNNPTRRAKLRVQNKDVLMTMDFLFDVAGGKRKIHLPVKMSTRERVVQAWSHQRLLDVAHGIDSYKGIMVLFSETKLNSRSLEVVEICVPDQWLVYQSLLARIDRIYYFDLPHRYETLSTSYPKVISIQRFEKFFKEKKFVLYQ